MFAFPANSELLRIAFVPFKVHMSFHEGQRLTVNVVEGDNAGFMDYQAIMVREDIVVLSWQEHIGSTIVHVLDFANDRTHTCVTPEKGGFLQLSGTLRSRRKEQGAMP
jgi:MoaF-like